MTDTQHILLAWAADYCGRPQNEVRAFLDSPHESAWFNHLPRPLQEHWKSLSLETRLIAWRWAQDLEEGWNRRIDADFEF